jgi:hypothetical protein
MGADVTAITKPSPTDIDPLAHPYRNLVPLTVLTVATLIPNAEAVLFGVIVLGAVTGVVFLASGPCAIQRPTAREELQ